MRKLPISLKNNLNIHPRLKSQVMRVVSVSPLLEERLRQVGRPSNASASNNRRNEINPESLAPGAKRIYFDLKASIEKQQKGRR